ncbi:hypothetical protein [Nocardia asiatica]|uniref:hypothetical protein n=1 Tax=Nocardia asiatica TaxID=209252 RepID=UPI003EE0D0C5
MPAESLAREALFGRRALRTPEAFAAALDRVQRQRSLDMRQPEYALLRAFHSAVSDVPIDITAEIRRLRVAQRLGIEDPYGFHTARHWETAVAHIEFQLAQERAASVTLDAAESPAARQRLEVRERLFRELVELVHGVRHEPTEGRPSPYTADAHESVEGRPIAATPSTATRARFPVSGEPLESAAAGQVRAETDPGDAGPTTSARNDPAEGDLDGVPPTEQAGGRAAATESGPVLTERQERALKDELVRDGGVPMVGYHDRAVPVEMLRDLAPLLRTLTERYPGALDGVAFTPLSEHGDGEAAVIRDGWLVLDPRVVGLPVSRSAADLPLRELVTRRFAEALLARNDGAAQRAGEFADTLRRQLRADGVIPAAGREWARFRRMTPEQAMIEAFWIVERTGQVPTHPTYAYYHALVDEPGAPLDLARQQRLARLAAEAGVPDPDRLGPGDWPNALTALRDRIDAEADDLTAHVSRISTRAALAAIELHRDRLARHATLFELVHSRPPEPHERPGAVELPRSEGQAHHHSPLPVPRTEDVEISGHAGSVDVAPAGPKLPVRSDSTTPNPVPHHPTPVPPPIIPPQDSQEAEGDRRVVTAEELARMGSAIDSSARVDPSTVVLVRGSGRDGLEALAVLDALAGGERFPLPDADTDHFSDSELQMRSGGRVLRIPDHDYLAAQLADPDHPAVMAVVVDRIGPVVSRYVVSYERGSIAVVQMDGTRSTFVPNRSQHVVPHAVLFDSGGNAVDPVGGDVHARPQSENGFSGTRAEHAKLILKAAIEQDRARALVAELAELLSLRDGQLLGPERRRTLEALEAEINWPGPDPFRATLVEQMVAAIRQQDRVDGELASMLAISAERLTAIRKREGYDADFRAIAYQLGEDHKGLVPDRVNELHAHTSDEFAGRLLDHWNGPTEDGSSGNVRSAASIRPSRRPRPRARRRPTRFPSRRFSMPVREWRPSSRWVSPGTRLSGSLWESLVRAEATGSRSSRMWGAGHSSSMTSPPLANVSVTVRPCSCWRLTPTGQEGMPTFCIEWATGFTCSTTAALRSTIGRPSSEGSGVRSRASSSMPRVPTPTLFRSRYARSSMTWFVKRLLSARPKRSTESTPSHESWSTSRNRCRSPSRRYLSARRRRPSR